MQICNCLCWFNCTSYNNKMYRVDDIDWNQNPTSKFKKGREEVEISYVDYYKQVLNVAFEIIIKAWYLEFITNELWTMYVFDMFYPLYYGVLGVPYAERSFMSCFCLFLISKLIQKSGRLQETASPNFQLCRMVGSLRNQRSSIFRVKRVSKNGPICKSCWTASSAGQADEI